MQTPRLEIPWIDSPFFERLLEESPHDEPMKERLRSYAEEGYLLIDPEIEGFDALAGDVVDQCSRRPEYGDRLTDAWDAIPAVRALACDPGILWLLEMLYARPPIPMQTLNFSRGSEQRAHSDAVHFSSVPRGYMCGVWIALEDVGRDCGPLVVYPGSHRLPAFDLSDLGILGSTQKAYERYPDYEDLIEILVGELGLERRVLTVPKGGAIIWASGLLHGGSRVRDAASTRHSQVTHYFFEDCLYYQPMRSDPFLGEICWLDKRDVRTGEVIPQVYHGRRLTGRAFGQAKRLEAAFRRTGLERLVRRLGLAEVAKRALRWVR